MTGVVLAAAMAPLVLATAARAEDDDPNDCAMTADYGPSPLAPVPLPSPTMDTTAAGRATTAPVVGGVVVLEQATIGDQPIAWVDEDRERFPDVDPEPVRSVAEHPVSTFSADVDTASYAVVRRFLTDGILPPSDAVRIEELVNYFDYDYAAPDDPAAPFEPTVVVHPSPWNPGTEILHIGIRALDPGAGERPDANLVWLVDVSGSMDDPAKLPLVRRSLRLLAAELDEDDTVAIVTYAGNAGIHLPPTSGDRRDRIERAIRALCPGGSTAGAEGLRTAYELAEHNFDPEAVNRVILATDGDLNVGVTDNERLEDFVARKRETGVYLTVLGYGQGNYQDARMQVLAQAGNGTAGYIDGIAEARKVLVDELASTLRPVANDVKIQVELNPGQVAEYRLIGYETRLLDREDFALDAVDAGDVGAGHTVTALYEIAAPGSDGLALDPLRYGAPDPEAGRSGEIAHLRIRYKLPGEAESRLIERAIVVSDRRPLEAAGDDARFAAAVAAFGQVLRREPQVAELDLDDIARLARGAIGEDERGLRRDFFELLDLAAAAAS